MYDGIRKNPEEYQEVCDFLAEILVDNITIPKKFEAFKKNREYFDNIENLNDIVDNRDANLIMIACEYNNAFFLQYFSDRGVNVNHIDYNGQNAFFYINYGLENEEDTFGFLFSKRVDLLKKNNDGVNLLMIATENSSIEYIMFFFANGIDINDVDIFNKNALFYINFLDNKAPKVMKLLLKYGIDPYKKNEDQNIIDYIESLFTYYDDEEKKILEQCINEIATWYAANYITNKFFDDPNFVKNTISTINYNTELIKKILQFTKENKEYLISLKNTLNTILSYKVLEIKDISKTVDIINSRLNSKYGHELIKLLQTENKDKNILFKKYKEAIEICDNMIKIIDLKTKDIMKEYKKYKDEEQKKVKEEEIKKAEIESKKAAESLIKEEEKEKEKKERLEKEKKERLEKEKKERLEKERLEKEENEKKENDKIKEIEPVVEIKKTRKRKKKDKKSDIEEKVNEAVTLIVTNVTEKIADLNIAENSIDTVANFITDVIDKTSDKIIEKIEESEPVKESEENLPSKDVEESIKDNIKEAIKEISGGPLHIDLTDSDFEDDTIVNEEIADPIVSEMLLDIYLETAYVIDKYDENVEKNYVEKINYMNTRLQNNIFFGNDRLTLESLNSFYIFINEHIIKIKYIFDKNLKRDVSNVIQSNIEYALKNIEKNLAITYKLYDYLLQWKIFILQKYLDICKRINDQICFYQKYDELVRTEFDLDTFRNVRL